MANYRQVHTKIWKDTWFLSLPPDDKLLFVYLFSNEQASIAGIYELPVMVIAFETGLSIEYATDALARFEAAGKVRYQDGIVWVVNLRKYNENPSPKVRTRIENDIALIPDLEIKRDYIQYHNGMDTVSIPELKTESEHEHEQEQEQEQEIEQEKESSPPTAEIAVPQKILEIQCLTIREIQRKRLIASEWEQLLEYEQRIGNPPRKGLVKFIEKKLANGHVTPEQLEYLALFGALGFVNRTQSRTVQEAITAHGLPVVIEVGTWAANRGMSLGKAITGLKNTAANWNSGEKRGNHGSNRQNRTTGTGESREPLPPAYDKAQVERDKELLRQHRERMSAVQGAGSTEV